MRMTNLVATSYLFINFLECMGSLTLKFECDNRLFDKDTMVTHTLKALKLN